jgi:hypothetical protein
MTKVNAARAIRLAAVLVIVATALDRFLGVNSMALLHGVLMLFGLALLGASVAVGAERTA